MSQTKKQGLKVRKQTLRLLTAEDARQIRGGDLTGIDVTTVQDASLPLGGGSVPEPPRWFVYPR